MGRRKSRYDRLLVSDAEAILRDALRLRATLLAAKVNLTASGALYWHLSGLTDRLHAVMEVIAEKELDFRAAGLGLLPLPEDYSSRK
ncbi:hypothetical protein EN829_020880 [Mesorhizobium sp. M00.F.Ca.ET.186.01.1.1]|nr:hypothetical protein EN848_28475 [bacterium M00.F.Ca.ET.205.01.1.1]TGU50466.1 hypothetical protein EN795_22925 [bacterium M00.F.Ca.ET.152.01.1.1]TGV33933.1 hypothetical protein EN829_020880 [Mesorhizobium sp. M00.F.Ca.ET.186.01.1.1]TGZ40830.1 hypothetical protein EN805_22320 [bacterium M00.F.Ca.ET.162.01.1.1]